MTEKISKQLRQHPRTTLTGLVAPIVAVAGYVLKQRYGLDVPDEVLTSGVILVMSVVLIWARDGKRGER